MEDSEKAAEMEEAARDIREGHGAESRLGGLPGEVLVELCGQVGTEPMLLDMWLSGKPDEEVAATLERCARRIRGREEKSGIPDSLMLLLQGKLERGVIHVPTELLRDLFATGLAVSKIRRGKARSAEVEDVAKRLLDRAADWADRVRENVKGEGAVVPVRPEEVPF